jgi:phenylacetate-CoA ligase
MWPRSLYYIWRSFDTLELNKKGIEKFQKRRLKDILGIAKELPFYQERISSKVQQDPELVSEMPVMDSNEFRRQSGEMRELLQVNSALSRHTSGTTGRPARVRFSKQAHDWLSAIYVRTFYLHGYKPRKSIVQFWEGMQDQRSWLGKLMMPKKYIQPKTELEKQAELIEQYNPEVLQYLPQMLLALAKLSSRESYSIEPDLILTYGENLTPSMKNYIEQVFDTEIRDQYATTEFGTVAWECPEGGYHIAEDSVYPEILNRSGEPVSEGKIGRLVLTSLVNEATPLIRYSIGDLVEKTEKSCSCNTSFRKIEKIIGRKENVFLDANGEPVLPNQVIDLVAQEEDLLFYQLIVEDESYKLLYVPNTGFEQDSVKSIAENLRTELSLEPLEIEEKDQIPRSNGGKITVIDNRQEKAGFNKVF